MGDPAALALLREPPRDLMPERLERLTQSLGLSDFERELVTLCFKLETEPEAARAVAELSGDANLNGVTVGLAHAVLGRVDWAATCSAGALRRWQVLRLTTSAPRVHERLRLAEAVTDGLLGLRTMDVQLVDMLVPLAPGDLLPAALTQEIAARLAELGDDQLSPLIVLPAGSADRAATIAHSLGLRAYAVCTDRLRSSRVPSFELQRVFERHSVFEPACFVLDLPAEPAEAAALMPFLEMLAAHVFVVGDVPVACRRRVHRCHLPPRQELANVEQWHHALGPRAIARLNGSVERVAEHFQLSARGIAAAGATVRTSIEEAADERTAEKLLWRAGSEAAWPRPGVLAQVIEPRASLNDVIVPEQVRADLDAIVRHVRHASTVYHHWGFDTRAGRQRGLAALFAGPSGTGKSLAAAAIAHELGLPLVVADFSQLQSKWVGETSKHIARLFGELERSGAVLLIDEADGLLGRRGQVVDAQDRHSNAEVAYFLQRLDNFCGLAILTTNLKGSIDSAFLRRYRFVIEFPLPACAERRRIWGQAFPSDAPCSGLDLEALARLPLTGGTICNVALNAAFEAAEAGQSIGPPHVLAALHAEYRKLERSPAELTASLDS